MFSQWTAVLDIMEWMMQELGLVYVRLDGSTPVADRLHLVDACVSCHDPSYRDPGNTSVALSSFEIAKNSMRGARCQGRSAAYDTGLDTSLVMT